MDVPFRARGGVGLVLVLRCNNDAPRWGNIMLRPLPRAAQILFGQIAPPIRTEQNRIEVVFRPLPLGGDEWQAFGGYDHVVEGCLGAPKAEVAGALVPRPRGKVEAQARIQPQASGPKTRGREGGVPSSKRACGMDARLTCGSQAHPRARRKWFRR